MKLQEKLLDYVSFETTSDESSAVCPSSSKELILGNHLVYELNKYGCDEVFIDDNGYVYGFYEANDPSIPTLGLIAHMDTSPDASGKDVKVKVIENFDCKDIKLNDNETISMERYPNMKKLYGKTLLVTDGTTLLGADDKAGIAIICEVLDQINNNPNIKHGNIRVCFTPDEEIGRGADLFNYNYFKDVDYCYTVDGSDFNAISYENFNAASALIEISGISVHPGSAKDKMVNAINVAHEFHGMLDSYMRPEHTEGRDGFNHLHDIKGDVTNCSLYYILRNFDKDLLDRQKERINAVADYLNKKYGYATVKTTIKDSYSNMASVFAKNTKTIDVFNMACEDLGIHHFADPIRGGTDGARISLNGIPTPNLGTGGDNFHGPHEYWCKENGEMVVKIILKMIEKL